MLTTRIFQKSTEPKLLDDAFSIRRKVFIEEQGVSEELELDDKDETATHVVAYENDIPVGCGRLITDNEFLIGRIAVLKEKRGERIGDLIVRVLIRRAFNMGANNVCVHSQMTAAGFYEKLGFVKEGDSFYEANIEHITMRKFEDVGGKCR